MRRNKASQRVRKEIKASIIDRVERGMALPGAKVEAARSSALGN